MYCTKRFTFGFPPSWITTTFNSAPQPDIPRVCRKTRQVKLLSHRLYGGVFGSWVEPEPHG